MAELDKPDPVGIPKTDKAKFDSEPWRLLRSGKRIGVILSHPGRVELSVFDAAGKRVCTLADEVLAAGSHSFIVPSTGLGKGLRFLRLRVGGRSHTRGFISDG